MARLAALSTVSLAALTLPVYAQVTQTWTDSVSGTAVISVGAVALHAVDGGDTVAIRVVETGIFGALEAVTTRLDENGDVLWGVSIALQYQSFDGVTMPSEISATAVAGDGTIAIAIAPAGPATLLVLNADGSQRWSTTVAPMTGPYMRLRDLEFSASGDLYVVANEYESEHVLPYIPNGEAALLRVDGVTGLEEWRVEQRGTYTTPELELDSGGDLHVIARSQDPGSNWAHSRFDGAGALLSETPFVLPINNLGLRGFEVAPSGRSVAFFYGYHNAHRTGVASFDASGAVQWSSDQADALQPGAILANGDYVLPGRAVVSRLQRFSPTGTFSQGELPAQSLTYDRVLALPDGGFVAGGNLIAGGAPSMGGLARYDATGQLVSSISFSTLVDGSGVLQQLVRDERGNAVAATRVVHATPMPFDAAVFELVLEGDPSTSFCPQAVPNSTGTPSALSVAGSDLVGENDVTLVFSNIPVGQTIMPINALAAGFVPNAGGSQGTLCLGGSIGRYNAPGQLRFADDEGRATLRIDLGSIPRPSSIAAAMAGETWYFQGWHRDANPAQTSNFTNGVSVLLQ